VSYLQPHEGIQGTERSGDGLLRLDNTSARDVIATLAYHLYMATLVGHAASMVNDLRERMTNPQVEDLVVISDARSNQIPEGVGYLVAHRAEWWTTDEQWEADKAESSLADEDRMVERDAWYVQYGPNPADVCRWVNCLPLAVPGAGDRWYR
jgi:hypothetical protein